MQVTEEGLGAERILVLSILAALTGLALARSRLTAAWAAVLGVGLGIGLIIVVLGGLLPPAWLLWREVGYVGDWWRSWRQGTPLQPVPFATAAGFAWQQLANLGNDFGGWVETIASGGEVEDQIGFLVLMASLAWGMGLFATWQIFRQQAPMAGLVPSGAGITIVAFLSGGATTALLIYLFCLLGITAALHLWTRQRQWEQTKTDYPGGMDLDLALVVLPWLLVLLFVAAFFPLVRYRQATRAFWQVMDRPWSAVEQITGQVFGTIESESPGGIGFGRLPQEHLLSGGPDLGKTIIMYVKTDDPAPPPPETEEDGPPIPAAPTRYWRGMTYDLYTGHGWDHSALEGRNYAVDQPLDPTLPAGVELRQDFEIVAPHGTLLYAVNAPLSVSHSVRAWWRAAGDLARLDGSVDQYTVISRPPEPTVRQLRNAQDTLPPDLAQYYLALPETLPRRVRDLAEEVTGDAATQYDRAKEIETYLRSHYAYTLELTAPPADRDVVDYFLFDLQKGYCDYYASAMVVMARSVGVPARFASGYAQGSYDYQASRWVITELNAHSWVEVYFDGVGWVEFEPTAGLPPVDRPGGEGAVGPDAAPSPPPGAFGGQFPWALAILSGILVLLAAMVLGIWRSHSLLAIPAAELIRDRHRRLLEWGRRLGQPPKNGQTPYEYGSALGDALAARGRACRSPGARQAGVEAPAEVGRLIDSFVRAQYGAEAIDEREGWQIRDLWKRLGRHLWRLWMGRPD
jgi:transglutaminase-like putative cysteine protease